MLSKGSFRSETEWASLHTQVPGGMGMGGSACAWCSLLSKEGLWCAFLYVVEVRGLLFLGVPLLESEVNEMVMNYAASCRTLILGVWGKHHGTCSKGLGCTWACLSPNPKPIALWVNAMHSG